MLIILFIIFYRYAATTILIRKVHILTGDFSWELYVLPDDDKRYAIEACRKSEKCFKKVI